jgi:hypothetical protein
VAGRKRREDVRLVEPVSLLGLSLADVLLGLVETGEGQPDPAPGDVASAAVENEPGCGCRTGGSSASRCSAASGAWTGRVDSRPLAS